MNTYIPKIKETASSLPHTKIMEVCGGHTNTILRYGINDILPSNIQLVAGPGCPVCVTSQKDIDSAIELALEGVPICTYGDLLHVPGSKTSLDNARSQGADIKMLLSATEALKHPDHVFFGIGFETTTPMTAFLLKKGIKVFSTHKIMPPPMKILAESESNIKGFIDPGHVSTITGSKMWSQLNVPQVISGFKPDQMIRAIYRLLKLIKENKTEVINDYDEVVTLEGNTKAKSLINQHMKIVNTEWRGFGTIPNSGLDPINPDLDAKIIYKNIIKNIKPKDHLACRCGEVVKGLLEPPQCPLFNKTCTPDSPIGACMVSEEGACSIYHRFGRSL
ncbi:hydrogenase formation protein HypD [Nanoarchaeota archaeon]